jgi:membrane-bound ClpP family serine protease
VQFGDRYVNVVSEGGWIEAGTRVDVVEVAGNRIVVRPHSQAAPDAAALFPEQA